MSSCLCVFNRSRIISTSGPMSFDNSRTPLFVGFMAGSVFSLCSHVTRLRRRVPVGRSSSGVKRIPGKCIPFILNDTTFEAVRMKMGREIVPLQYSFLIGRYVQGRRPISCRG